MNDDYLPGYAIISTDRAQQIEEIVGLLADGDTLPKLRRRDAVVREVLSSPSVQAEISRRVSLRLRGEDRARIRAVLRGFIDDDALDGRTRIMACGKLADMIDKDLDRDAYGGREPDAGEMTGDQLREHMKRLQAEMGRRADAAKDVGGAVIDADPEG